VVVHREELNQLFTESIASKLESVYIFNTYLSQNNDHSKVFLNYTK